MQIQRFVAASLIAFTGLAAAPASNAPSTDPSAVLVRLKDGNDRFVANPGAPPPVDEGRREAL
ncbi:MAG: hypothetical protein AB7N90_13570, partial [Vicinamibacterales bacterium]